ncbi:MAG TPA: G1 family glutamic endopeptidase [Methylocella sp.]|nr:G1 family glutamic endopeptidase [Methylocella sp.]
MGRFICFFAAMALLLAVMLTSAQAQGTTTAPGNGPPAAGTYAGRPMGVGVVPAPPTNFNPLTASPAVNAQYGIPPAPDPTIAPGAYNEWRRAVTGPQVRVAPVLRQTTILHGPLQKRGATVPLANANNVVTTTSTNWSGSSVVNSQNPFQLEAIIAEFVVPTARQAFGSCTGGTDYAAIWPGIDGNGSKDVLQAGVEVDAYCNGGTTQGYYSAWIEWYPNYATEVTSPVIHPGDLVLVEVYNTTPTNGYAYFMNFSTQEVAVYQLTAPGGTTLVGNSVEWIVERPTLNTGLANLTNYIAAPLSYEIAWNYTANPSTYYYAGYTPPAGTLELITMLDNNNKGISSATVENFYFLWFQNFGSSCGISGAPPC